MRSVAALGSPPDRDRVLVGGCVVVATALAWAYLIHLDRGMSSSVGAGGMAEMGMITTRPWGVRDVGYTFVMWAVMMVGMMAPAAWPMLHLFAGAQARRAQRRRLAAVLSFALGYVAVWVGFSVGAAVLQWALHRAALLSSMAAASTPTLAGTILIAAGIYQLTPAKSACLTHCRSPLGFLVGHWRDGLAGALRMGLRHGAYCLGCCWALMVVLFAVGVMNLAWVALLTAAVLAEKLGPAGVQLARVGGVLLIVYGAVVALR